MDSLLEARESANSKHGCSDRGITAAVQTAV